MFRVLGFSLTIDVGAESSLPCSLIFNTVKGVQSTFHSRLEETLEVLYTAMNAGTGAGDVRGLAGGEAIEEMIRHAKPESITRVVKSIQTAASGAIKEAKTKTAFLEWCLEMLEKV